MMNKSRLDAIERAIELKYENYTIREIVEILKSEGYVVTDRKRTLGKPFGYYSVSEWCRGKNKQTGKKDRSLSDAERKERRRQSKLRARRLWYARHKEEVREKHNESNRELRAFYRSQGIKYWLKS